MEIRHLASLEEYRACADLQRTTWGENFADVVPGSLLQVSQKVGGLLAGAFKGTSLIGFVYSLFGTYENEVSHWSHMLAVHPAERGHGLGRHLKLFQRHELLKRGIRTVFWTFDPLVAANAHLNLNRLGAGVDRYVPNMYGDETGSPLHAGGETDRLIVRWDLDSPRTRWAVDEEVRPPYDIELEESFVVSGPDETGESGAVDDPGGNEIFIEIPSDTEDSIGPSDLARWRTHVREAFMTYLRRGYAVQSLHRDFETRRSYYFLRRP